MAGYQGHREMHDDLYARERGIVVVNAWRRWWVH
jgi:hypothetical protein